MIQVEIQTIIESNLEEVFDAEWDLYDRIEDPAQRLQMRVAETQWPVYFRDEMVAGPFKSMVHEHHFAAVDANRTVKCDILEVTAPFGVLGWLNERLFLRRRIERLLTEKSRALKERLESEP